MLNYLMRYIDAYNDYKQTAEYKEKMEIIKTVKLVFKRIGQAIGFIIECVVSIISIGIAMLILEALFM